MCYKTREKNVSQLAVLVEKKRMLSISVSYAEKFSEQPNELNPYHYNTVPSSLIARQPTSQRLKGDGNHFTDRYSIEMSDPCKIGSNFYRAQATIRIPFYLNDFDAKTIDMHSLQLTYPRYLHNGTENMIKERFHRILRVGM